jgi:hypothetical protein
MLYERGINKQRRVEENCYDDECRERLEVVRAT